jgi:hypothetical protein
MVESANLSGADRAEETVFRENPDGSFLLPLPLDPSNLCDKRTDLVAVEPGDRHNPVNVVGSVLARTKEALRTWPSHHPRTCPPVNPPFPS